MFPIWRPRPLIRPSRRRGFTVRLETLERREVPATLANPLIVGGGLAPEVYQGPESAIGVISTNRPTFEGTAEPYSYVQVTAIGPANLGQLVLGQTVANPDGIWRLQVGPLADGAYIVSATISPPAGFAEKTVLMGNQGRVVIDTIGPEVLSVGYDRGRNQLVVVMQDPGSGLNLDGLNNPRNFSITAPGRRIPLRFLATFQSVQSEFVTPNDPTLARTIITPATPLHPGRYNLRLAPTGLADRAGNALSMPTIINFTASPLHPVRPHGHLPRRAHR